MATMIPCDTCNEEPALLLVSDVNTGTSYGVGAGCLVGWCVSTIIAVDPETGDKIVTALVPPEPETSPKTPTKATKAAPKGAKTTPQPEAISDDESTTEADAGTPADVTA